MMNYELDYYINLSRGWGKFEILGGADAAVAHTD